MKREEKAKIIGTLSQILIPFNSIAHFVLSNFLSYIYKVVFKNNCCVFANLTTSQHTNAQQKQFKQFKINK